MTFVSVLLLKTAINKETGAQVAIYSPKWLFAQSKLGRCPTFDL